MTDPPGGNRPANTVLVTGAAGFIGFWIVEEFVARSWRVLALVHRNREARWQRHVQAGGGGSVMPVVSDITDADRLREDLRAAVSLSPASIDVVVHAAGRASDVGRQEEFRRLNLDGTRNVGSLALELGVQRFVFISTTDVYGIRDFHGEAEDQLPLGMTVRNPYPEFKILAEEWIRDTLPPHRYAILRPGAVWGPGDTTLTPRMLNFLKASPAIVHFGPWRGTNRWPLAHVKNVATAAYLAATHPDAAGQAFNVLDPEHTSLDRFYRLLAQAFLPNRRFRTLHLPAWMAKGMGWGVSALSNVLNLNQPFADPSFYAAHHVSSNLDLSTARLEALFHAAGRDFVTLEDGMQELRTRALEEGAS